LFINNYYLYFDYKLSIMNKDSLKSFYGIFNVVFYTFIVAAIIVVAIETIRLFDPNEIVRHSMDAHRLETPTPQVFDLVSKETAIENAQLTTNKWTISFVTTSWPLRIYRFALVLVRTGFVVVLLIILRAFVQSLRVDETFTILNVRRLQRIGILLLLIEPFGWIGKYLTRQWLIGLLNLDVTDKSVSYRIGEAIGFALGSWDLVSNWLLAGLLVLVIAEVFKQGLKLKEEVDLTV
jgi:hypothetical protein